MAFLSWLRGLFTDAAPTAAPQPDPDPPATPAPSAKLEQAREALAKLLLSLFASDELRRHVAYGPKGAVIGPRLPGMSVPPVAVAAAVVHECETHELIDDAFFTSLLKERPRRAADIDPVAALWRDLKR